MLQTEEIPSKLIDRDLISAYNSFIDKWSAIYYRNFADGYPQYNSFYFVLYAHPHYATILRKAASDMVLSGYAPDKVDHFLEVYKVPCREVRLSRKAQVLELKRLGEKSKEAAKEAYRKQKHEAIREQKNRDRANSNRKNSKQKELSKDSDDRQVSKINTQQGLL